MRYVGSTGAWVGAVCLLLFGTHCGFRGGSSERLGGSGTGTGTGTGSGTGSGSGSGASSARADVFAHYYFWWSEDDCAGKALKPIVGVTAAGTPVGGWYGNQWWGFAVPPIEDAPSLAAWQKTMSTVSGQIRSARTWGFSGFALQWKGKNYEPELRASRFDDDFIRDVFLPAVATVPDFRFLLTMDLDQWFEYHGFTRDSIFRPIDFDSTSLSRFPAQPGGTLHNNVREQFIADVEYLCATYADHPQYYRIDGKTVLFLYDFHAFSGNFGPALSTAADRCRLAGVEPYLVGDFVLAPGAVGGYEARKEPWYYAAKAQLVDAVTAYSSLFGLDPRASDSTTQILADGRYDQVLRNGAELGRAATKPFFPVITPQYFRMTRAANACSTATPSGAGGSYPLSRLSDGADVYATSQATIAGLWAKIRGMSPAPKLVFVTSWNEPVEGTMVEPTISPNPTGYVMGWDFVNEVQRYSTGR